MPSKIVSAILKSFGVKLFILVSIATNAQTLDWVTTWGASNDGIITTRKLAVDAQGNVYTTGSFNNTVDFDPGPKTHSVNGVGYYDGYIQKLDQHGNLQWLNTITGLGYQFVQSCVLSKSNYLYVSGSYTYITTFNFPNDTFTKTAYGGYNSFILKLDTAGNLIWHKHIECTGNSHVYNFALDSTENIFLTGSFDDTTHFNARSGLPSRVPLGRKDAYVSKLDSNGNCLWVQQIGGRYASSICYNVANNEGNAYVTGRFNYEVSFGTDSGAVTLKSRGVDDGFVLRIDTSGSFDWVCNFGSPAHETGGPLVIKDSIILSFNTFSDTTYLHATNASDTLFAKGQYDILLLALDLNGNKKWCKTIGGPGFEFLGDISFYKNNQILINGCFQDSILIDSGTNHIALYKSNNVRLFESFIIHLDSVGNYLKSYQFNTDNAPSDIHVDALEAIYSYGRFEGTSDLGLNKGVVYKKAVGNMDAYIQKIVECEHVRVDLFDTICVGDSITFYDQLITNRGTYQNTIHNSNYCDTVVSLYVEVLNHTSSDDDVHICLGDSIMFKESYIRNQGTYLDTTMNFDGCDSFIKINVVTHESSFTVLSDTMCEGDSIWFVDTYLKKSGFYIDTISDQYGCDSTLLLNVTALSAQKSHDSVFACDSFTWLDNHTYDSSIYDVPFVVTTKHGCDSVIYLQLTLGNIDTSLNRNKNSLWTNEKGANYQWYNCTTGLKIPGAVQSTFTPSFNSIYRVQITKDRCSKSSECIDFNLSTPKAMFKGSLGGSLLYPNPTKSQIAVKYPELITCVTFYSSTGQHIQVYYTVGSADIIDVSSFPQGVYMCKIELTSGATKLERLQIVK